MNRVLYYIITLTFLFLGAQTMLAQADSITISKAEPDSIDVKYDRVYKLFVQDKDHEIKHLIKLNLVNIDLLMPTLAYEQKLSRNFSMEVSMFIAYKHLLFDESDSLKFYPTYQFKGSDLQCFSIGGYQMIKLYHNLNRLERLGKNTNGFSGNYFALKLSENYSWLDDFYHKEPNADIFLENKYYLVPALVYGIQRRIGNIGYGDLSLCLNYFPDYIRNADYPWELGLETGITFKLGFAIESISSLKNTLKK